MLLVTSRAQSIDAIMVVFGHRHHFIQASICSSPPLLARCGCTQVKIRLSSKRVRIGPSDFEYRSQRHVPTSQLQPNSHSLHRITSNAILRDSSVRIRCLVQVTGSEGESDRAMAAPDVADLAMRARLAISPEEVYILSNALFEVPTHHVECICTNASRIPV